MIYWYEIFNLCSLYSHPLINYAYATVGRQQWSEELPHLRILFADIFAISYVITSFIDLEKWAGMDSEQLHFAVFNNLYFAGNYWLNLKMFELSEICMSIKSNIQLFAFIDILITL